MLYFGHGTETTLGIPTLVDTVTIASAHGQVLVAVACLAADTFGPSAVRGTHLSTFLGFSEPLFLHTAQPGLFGYEISVRMGGYLTGASTLTQAATDLTADLKAIEALYRTGAGATHPDSPLVWMGTRMNWRGLEVH